MLDALIYIFLSLIISFLVFFVLFIIYSIKNRGKDNSFRNPGPFSYDEEE